MKRILLCAVLLGVILLTASCNISSQELFDINSVKSYKDIPEVTQEEISAIESLKMTRKSFSYGHTKSTEAFKTENGEYAGFTYKFCDLLTNLFDIEFVPEYCESWDELKTCFDQRSIDFIGDLTSTAERMQLYYMTHAITERSLRIFTYAGSDKIVTETDVNGLRIGFLTGTITAESIKKAYPVSFEVVNVDNYFSAAEKLKSGEIDAVVMEGIADPAFDDYDFIYSREFFPLVYSPVSFSTANPDLEPIITVLDKYIVAGGVDKLYELSKEGDNEYISNKLFKSFTDKEKAYLVNLLETGGKVGIAAEYDNYPVSFYNEEDKEFQGIAIDVLNQISKFTDIEFKPMTTKETSWAEIMMMLKTGEVSMVTELIYSDARVADYIWASTPITSSYYALLSKADYPDLVPHQVIGATVGAMGGSIYEDMYNIWFPDNVNLITYDNQNDALDALENGEIELMMATENLLLTQTNYREKPGYKINISFSTPIDSLFGFNADELLLRSIIDKTLIYINIDHIDRNWTNRTFDYSAKMANIRAGYLLFFSVILTVILLVIIFLLFRTKQLSKKLMWQTEEAKVASKSKSAFLASMSHEIRTPLNAIIGMSGIAKNSIADHEKAVSAINQVISSSHHLLNILNDVLDMSKIESGKLELVYDQFSLHGAYNEVSAIITQSCREKDIDFITNIGEIKDCFLIGDKMRINQVLINLLGNAVKFSKNNSEIMLTVNVLEETEQKIKLKFIVADNGIGMTEEQMSKLFMPFEQTDKSINVKFGGTGLGLSISQNLINMMGSKIYVESKQNAGSKFYFELLFNKGSMEAQKSFEARDVINLAGKKILLVEDIDINRIIICEMLSDTGVEIDNAEDGQQAIDIFNSSPVGYYNLIFMDIQMPIFDGYETTRRIRELERRDAQMVPIVAMTANAYKDDIEDAFAAGMNGHLSKPIDADKLMQLLVDFLVKEELQNQPYPQA